MEAPLEAATLPREPFDLILMLQLVEHLREPESCLLRLAEALPARGGY